MGIGAHEQDEMSTLPFKLFLLGFLMVFVGVIVLIAAAMLQGEGANTSSFVLVFVGPIPIILGAGPYAPILMVLAVILTIIGFVVFFRMRKQTPNRES